MFNSIFLLASEKIRVSTADHENSCSVFPESNVFKRCFSNNNVCRRRVTVFVMPLFLIPESLRQQLSSNLRPALSLCGKEQCRTTFGVLFASGHSSSTTLWPTKVSCFTWTDAKILVKPPHRKHRAQFLTAVLSNFTYNASAPAIRINSTLYSLTVNLSP